MTHSRPSSRNSVEELFKNNNSSLSKVISDDAYAAHFLLPHLISNVLVLKSWHASKPMPCFLHLFKLGILFFRMNKEE